MSRVSLLLGMLLFDCDVIELTSKVTIFFWIVQGGGGAWAGVAL